MARGINVPKYTDIEDIKFCQKATNKNRSGYKVLRKGSYKQSKKKDTRRKGNC